MRFLPLAALCTVLLCSCRSRSDDDEAHPSSGSNTPLALHTGDSAPPSPTNVGSQDTPSDTSGLVPDVVLRYRTAWDKIRTTVGPVRIPEFWALADSSRDTLTRSMESFSPATFQRAESLMVWHSLSRSEVIAVSPVYDSFLALARRRGTPADTAYFAYFAAQDKDGWRTQVTDITACDELGSPNLFTSLMGAERLRTDPASPYRNRWPDPAKDVRESIEYGLCACGTSSATLRDFQQNLGLANSPASLRPLLDSLRAILRAPRSKDRFECRPG